MVLPSSAVTFTVATLFVPSNDAAWVISTVALVSVAVAATVGTCVVPAGSFTLYSNVSAVKPSTVPPFTIKSDNVASLFLSLVRVTVFSAFTPWSAFETATIVKLSAIVVFATVTWPELASTLTPATVSFNAQITDSSDISLPFWSFTIAV